MMKRASLTDDHPRHHCRGYYIMVSQSAALSATAERAAITITATTARFALQKPRFGWSIHVTDCPPCAGFKLDVLPLLKAKYVERQVYFIFGVFPLNPADLAAEAIGRCFPQQLYALHRHPVSQSEGWDPEFGVTDVHAALVAMGRWRVDAAHADQCIENKAQVERATQVGEEAQKLYDVTTFVVDGGHVGELSEQLQKLLIRLPKK